MTDEELNELESWWIAQGAKWPTGGALGDVLILVAEVRRLREALANSLEFMRPGSIWMDADGKIGNDFADARLVEIKRALDNALGDIQRLREENAALQGVCDRLASKVGRQHRLLTQAVPFIGKKPTLAAEIDDELCEGMER